MTVLTAKQTKTLNLILAEHNKWSQQVPLLNAEIANLKALNQIYVEQDSLRIKEVDVYKEQYQKDKEMIAHLERSSKLWKKTTFAGGVIIIGLVLGLICR